MQCSSRTPRRPAAGLTQETMLIVCISFLYGCHNTISIWFILFLLRAAYLLWPEGQVGGADRPERRGCSCSHLYTMYPMIPRPRGGVHEKSISSPRGSVSRPGRMMLSRNWMRVVGRDQIPPPTNTGLCIYHAHCTTYSEYG